MMSADMGKLTGLVLAEKKADGKTDTECGQCGFAGVVFDKAGGIIAYLTPAARGVVKQLFRGGPGVSGSQSSAELFRLGHGHGTEIIGGAEQVVRGWSSRQG